MGKKLGRGVREVYDDARAEGRAEGLREAADELDQRIEILTKLGAPGHYENAIHELKTRKSVILAAIPK